jgi:hypothetical protein
MGKLNKTIQLSEFDNLLKTQKGWVKNVSGKEYVYDYRMKKFPNIIIKVLTGIAENDIMTKPNKDIRVFVIKETDKGIIGYSTAIIVKKTENWRIDVEKAVWKKVTDVADRELR